MDLAYLVQYEMPVFLQNIRLILFLWLVSYLAYMFGIRIFWFLKFHFGKVEVEVDPFIDLKMAMVKLYNLKPVTEKALENCVIDLCAEFIHINQQEFTDSIIELYCQKYFEPEERRYLIYLMCYKRILRIEGKG